MAPLVSPDLDEIIAMIEGLIIEKNILLSQIASLTNQVNKLESIWPAPSIVKFKQDYETLHDQITRQLDILDHLLNELSTYCSQADEYYNLMG